MRQNERQMREDVNKKVNAVSERTNDYNGI